MIRSKFQERAEANLCGAIDYGHLLMIDMRDVEGEQSARLLLTADWIQDVVVECMEFNHSLTQVDSVLMAAAAHRIRRMIVIHGKELRWERKRTNPEPHLVTMRLEREADAFAFSLLRFITKIEKQR